MIRLALAAWMVVAGGVGVSLQPAGGQANAGREAQPESSGAKETRLNERRLAERVEDLRSEQTKELRHAKEDLHLALERDHFLAAQAEVMAQEVERAGTREGYQDVRKRAADLAADQIKIREKVALIQKKVAAMEKALAGGTKPMTDAEFAAALKEKEVVEIVFVGPEGEADAAAREVKEAGGDGLLISWKAEPGNVAVLRMTTNVAHVGPPAIEAARETLANRRFATYRVRVWSDTPDAKTRAEGRKLVSSVAEDFGVALQSVAAGATLKKPSALLGPRLAEVGFALPDGSKGRICIFEVTTALTWRGEADVERWALFPKLGLVAACTIEGGAAKLTHTGADKAVWAAFDEALTPLMKRERVTIQSGAW